MSRRPILFVTAALLAVLVAVPVAGATINRGPVATGELEVDALTALGSGFTYQGRLTDAGAPANGAYDIRFILFDAETGGAQVGSTIEKADVAVANGLFTTELDFGAASFDGNARWMELAIRPGNQTGNYTVLSPRQPITPVPYAIYAKSAGIALPFTGTATSAADTALINITQSGAGAALKGAAATGVGANLSGATGLVVSGTTFAINASGAVQVDGQITRDFGDAEFSPAGPIAYGTISSEGTVTVGTANVTNADATDTGEYQVLIAGETINNTDYVVTVSPVGAPLIATWSAAGGNLNVSLFDADGAATNGAFSFAVYKP